MYFFLVEQLCEYFGERLYSDLWERLPSDKLMRTIDAYFTRKGVAENIRFNGIMTDRNVDPLGWDHDGIGFIENWQVKWVLQRLDPLDVMGLDKEAALGIITIYNWLKKADEAGRGLVFVCG